MVENVTATIVKRYGLESPLTITPECMKMKLLVNRTKGFVNLNRFKSGRAIKQLSKISHDKHKKTRGERGQGRGQQG